MVFLILAGIGIWDYILMSNEWFWTLALSILVSIFVDSGNIIISFNFLLVGIIECYLGKSSCYHYEMYSPFGVLVQMC